MKIKTIVDEDFVNYGTPSMFVGTSTCGGKCCIEAGVPISTCQNDSWRSCSVMDIDDDVIIRRYLQNYITSAIVFGGLEPFEQYDEVLSFITKLRNHYLCNDTVVIYTGYNENEIHDEVAELSMLQNIVIKFGRFVPNASKRFDTVLGVWLASDNQYAVRIS